MKLTISQSERLEIASNSSPTFFDVDSRVWGLIHQTLSWKTFSRKREVNYFHLFPLRRAGSYLFEKISLMLWKNEVLRWEQEKIEWMMDADDVARLI